MITIDCSSTVLLKPTLIHLYKLFLEFGLIHILRVTLYRMRNSCCVQRLCQHALSLATCNVATLDTALNKNGNSYGILYFTGN